MIINILFNIRMKIVYYGNNNHEKVVCVKYGTKF